VKAENVDAKYGDVETGDFLIALLQKHEMTAWMLRSYQGGGLKSDPLAFLL